jgi:hypothetical protein
MCCDILLNEIELEKADEALTKRVKGMIARILAKCK